MPRTKKSRKSGQIGTPKQSSLRSQPDAKKKKLSKGHASGSRNSLLEQNSVEPKRFSESKDKRHGSKKKIDLLAENRLSFKEQKSILPKFTSPNEELDFIENDKKLQSLLDKVDQKGSVTQEEQQYIDTLLSRHKILCDLMGIEIEERDNLPLESADVQNDSIDSDDLLDQLDRDFKF